MTSQELSNMIFEIKDKLTDKEFKDIMDKLSIKKKEQDDCFYELKYIEQKPIVVGRNDEHLDKCYVIKTYYKKKIIKIEIEEDCVLLEDFIKEPASFHHLCHTYFNFIDRTVLRVAPTRYNSPYYFDKEYVNTSESVDGLWIQFEDVIPISIKKL